MSEQKGQGKCPGCGCECGRPLPPAAAPPMGQAKSCVFTPCGTPPPASPGVPELHRCPQCGAVLR